MDTAFWQQQWTAFITAPVPPLIFLAVGAASAWWLCKGVSQGTIDGLRERVGALGERRQLIAEKLAERDAAAVKMQEDLGNVLGQLQQRLTNAAVEQTRRATQERINAWIEYDRDIGKELWLPIRRWSVRPRRLFNKKQEVPANEEKP